MVAFISNVRVQLQLQEYPASPAGGGAGNGEGECPGNHQDSIGSDVARAREGSRNAAVCTGHDRQFYPLTVSSDLTGACCSFHAGQQMTQCYAHPKCKRLNKLRQAGIAEGRYRVHMKAILKTVRQVGKLQAACTWDCMRHIMHLH